MIPNQVIYLFKKFLIFVPLEYYVWVWCSFVPDVRRISHSRVSEVEKEKRVPLAFVQFSRTGHCLIRPVLEFPQQDVQVWHSELGRDQRLHLLLGNHNDNSQDLLLLSNISKVWADRPDPGGSSRHEPICWTVPL